jgi:tetratricopeptide (TPR) repeat protein
MVEATERARKAALDALARAPDLPEAHLVLARIHVFYDWDRKAARASIGRALDLVPDHAEGLRMMAQFATDLGELPDAIARAERAVELDPLSPTACTTLGFLLRAAGRAAEAVTAYERMLELTPQRTGGRLLLGLALWKAGRLEDALTAIEEEPATWAKLTGLAAFHHLAGRKTESDAAFEELVADHADSSAYQIAAVCAVRGEREAMFSWLDHALETRDAGLAFAPLEVVFQPYHEDPRWAELRKMLGLESASSGGRG